jgi:GNAT superfamily N-acetyltransferase
VSPASLDEVGWLERVRASMIATWRTLARANGAITLERDGVFGMCNPRVPGRSVFNSAGYTDPAAFLAAREELAGLYEQHGCAWTVWVPERDEEVAGALSAAGHVLDAAPRAMGLDLEGVEEPDMGALEWTADGDLEAACLINDHAYGLPEGTWVKGNGRDPEGLRIYLASERGTPVATVATLTHGEDCEIWSVATEPEARNRGLSTALMRRSLWDARLAGCATSTLQATKLGRPVYERVGFRDFGALQMWERRPLELEGEAQRKPPA